MHDIDEEEGHLLPLPFGTTDHLPVLIMERPTAGQTRQGIRSVPSEHPIGIVQSSRHHA